MSSTPIIIHCFIFHLHRFNQKSSHQLSLLRPHRHYISELYPLLSNSTLVCKMLSCAALLWQRTICPFIGADDGRREKICLSLPVSILSSLPWVVTRASSALVTQSKMGHKGTLPLWPRLFKKRAAVTRDVPLWLLFSWSQGHFA